MRPRHALAVGLALVTLSACSAEEKGSDDHQEKGRKAVAVTVADSAFGKILTDGAGRTLYGFTRDKDGRSDCGPGCVAVWPALTTPSAAEVGTGVQEDLLQKTERTKGVQQVRYGEWPLYYYVGDVARGDVNGQGLDGEWFVVAADGKLVKEQAE
jgi:predicted lipoprotein with Yx(FWY)xxD motif